MARAPKKTAPKTAKPQDIQVIDGKIMVVRDDGALLFELVPQDYILKFDMQGQVMAHADFACVTPRA